MDVYLSKLSFFDMMMTSATTAANVVKTPNVNMIVVLSSFLCASL